MIAATETIYEKSEKGITLSAPLHEVESRMNQIKLSVLTGRKSVAQAEEKKNELVMYLAHDIRTPLTTVIGYLNLLNEAPDMPPEQRKKYIKTALDKSERLDVLINELFDLTRSHSKAVSLHKTDLDLSCLLSQIADEFYPALSANGNTVNVPKMLDNQVFYPLLQYMPLYLFSSILRKGQPKSPKHLRPLICVIV